MRSRIELAAAFVVVLAIAGCASSATASPSASPAVAASPVKTMEAAIPTAAPTSTPTARLAARLIVLADGVEGGTGLWSLDSGGRWMALGATPGATALGRTPNGIVVASGHELDRRPASDLGHAGTVTSLKWSGAAPAAPVVAIDSSPAGKLAMATSDEHTLNYWLAASDGTVTAMTSAPTQSFSPLVAWLAESRVLALSTDNQQISRLVDVNLSTHSIETSNAVLGATTFDVSRDGKSVAVATEKTVYAESVAAVLSGAQPQQIAALADSQIVWALSMDAAGTQVYVLAATEAADGTINSFHEFGYARQGSSWTKVLDSPAPFAKVVAQVCLA
jgi:WD40 repeat protein